MNRICASWRAYGRVQGVGFRYFVLHRASVLGLDGWVRNMPDGSVETAACGEQSSITRLRDELAAGPPHARVDRLLEEAPPPGLEKARGFTIK